MTTSTLQTSINNDLVLTGNGDLVIINDINACAQDVRAATLMRRGEDIFSTGSGVGYFEYIFAPQQSYDDARKSISDAIMSSPDVIGIESLDVQIDGNNFNFTARVMTRHGATTIQV